MKKRHFNLAMLVAALFGGFGGFVLGELIVKGLRYEIPDIVLVGLYFAVFATCVLTACALAESVFPRIAGNRWHKEFKKKTIAISVPLILIVFFAIGCLLQFIYSLGEIDYIATAEPDDYCFVVDNSGSMSGEKVDSTAKAMSNMIANLPEDKKAGCIYFDTESYVISDMKFMTQANKDALSAAVMDNSSNAGGGTDIEKAFSSALNLYNSNMDEFGSDSRNKCVVLVSDGMSYISLNQTINAFNAENIAVFVVGVDMGLANIRLFEELADRTNGKYYDAQSVSQLDLIFTNIGKDITKSNRILIDHRYSSERNSRYYAAIRIIMLALIGIAMGAALGMIFDNKALIKNFMIGGVITGLLAGLAIEYGCHNYLNVTLTRFISDVLLSMVISMFSAIRSYEKDSTETSYSFRNKGDKLTLDNNMENNTFVGRMG